MAEHKFFHDDYRKREQQFCKLRDCFEGQDAIREAATTYLPRPAGMVGAEGDLMYAAYKARAPYYPVLERTLRCLLGIVFRVPPQVEVPTAMQPGLESVTSEGDSLHESLRYSVLEALHMGRHGLLLDLPQGEATDARPYVVQYTAEDITDWRERVVNGRKELTMVMLRDSARAGDTAENRRFRELVLLDGVYIQRCWSCKADKGGITPLGEPEVIVPSIRGASLGYIPFVFIGPYSNKPGLEKSPMLDLANATIDHYQVGADWRHALHMLAQPTPYIAGNVPDELVPKTIGAGAFWVLPEGTRADMLEYSGAGVGSLQDALEKLENNAAALGAKLIHRGRQPETAEAVRVKARDEISVVESVVTSVEDAYRWLLQTAAEWLGLDRKAVRFGMDRDFIEEKLDAGMLQTLIKACFAEKAISRQVFHTNLQRGGVMPTSRSVQDEINDGATGQADTGDTGGKA